MKSYEIVENGRSTFYIILYSIISVILFFFGKVVTFLFCKLFDGKFSTYIHEKLWFVVGILLIFLFFASIWKRMFQDVEPGNWRITLDEFLKREHWIVYGSGKHVCSILESKFKDISTFRITDTLSKIKASTLDDDVEVSATFSFWPISPAFVVLDKSDPYTAAKKIVIARIKTYIEYLTKQFPSDSIVGQGEYLSNYVQTCLNRDTELRQQGIAANVFVEDIDYSAKVSTARSEVKGVQLFTQAVDALAGKADYLRTPNGELIYEDGKPVWKDADVTREEAIAAIIAYRTGKGFERSKDERVITLKIEGDPKVLAGMRALGVRVDTGENHDDGGHN